MSPNFINQISVFIKNKFFLELVISIFNSVLFCVGLKTHLPNFKRPPNVPIKDIFSQ